MESPTTPNKRLIDDLSIGELRIRLMLLGKIIREAQKDGDPRWTEAARQQRVINEVLVEKIKEARRLAGEPEPEHIKVNMQPARMRGRATTA